MKLIDLTGKKYNHLLVIERAENSHCGVSRWKCLCDCGNETIVRAANLKNGAVKSCGCLRSKPWNKKHGLSNTRLYRKWQSMKRRCYDISAPQYKHYGGRGICVCDEWKNNFEAFQDWSLLTMGDESLTLERIDVNGDYSPDNCTWVDKKSQANNRTSCVMITYQGKTQNLMQWCEELGKDYKLVHCRMFRSRWTFEDAISKPVKHKVGG